MAGDEDYVIALDGRSIMCFVCGMTSHNIHDVEQRYCGYCHFFHEEAKAPREREDD